MSASFLLFSKCTVHLIWYEFGDIFRQYIVLLCVLDYTNKGQFPNCSMLTEEGSLKSKKLSSTYLEEASKRHTNKCVAPPFAVFYPCQS